MELLFGAEFVECGALTPILESVILFNIHFVLEFANIVRAQRRSEAKTVWRRRLCYLGEFQSKFWRRFVFFVCGVHYVRNI